MKKDGIIDVKFGTGGTTLAVPIRWRNLHFNPRSPCGERLIGGCDNHHVLLDFNPRSPCGERHRFYSMEGRKAYFNPRSPCGERQLCGLRNEDVNDFNPRSPCGERRLGLTLRFRIDYFNPRSPCGERHLLRGDILDTRTFQSTLPVRGATGREDGAQNAQNISIHAPRAGSDSAIFSKFSPRGLFQSTLPVRGATTKRRVDLVNLLISIHAPRAGSDVLSSSTVVAVSTISIHAPRAGSDSKNAQNSHAFLQRFTHFKGYMRVIPSAYDAKQHHIPHFSCPKQVRTRREKHVRLGFASR